MYILVTYDVDTTSKEGARRLRCVAKACIDYGQRVQNSVFECEVTEAQYCLLRGRIKDIIDMSRDSVRFYILSKYLQLIIPQYFISNKSGIWSLSLIVHSKG